MQEKCGNGPALDCPPYLDFGRQNILGRILRWPNLEYTSVPSGLISTSMRS